MKMNSSSEAIAGAAFEELLDQEVARRSNSNMVSTIGSYSTL